MLKISRCNLLIPFALSIASVASATTYTASSCNLADVQAKVNKTVAGDTVNVPAGVCNWSGALIVGRPDPWTPATGSGNINIIGAGEGNTIINLSGSSSLTFKLSGIGTFRLSGFTVNVNGLSGDEGVIMIRGESGAHRKGWRVDHMTLNNLGHFGIFVVPELKGGFCQSVYNYGLIDHVTVTKTTGNPVQAFSIFGYCRELSGPGYLESGESAWTQGDMPGTENAVYIEDCNITYANGASDGVFDAYNGARLVFRHNTVSGTAAGVHGMDSGPRSARWVEMYNNVFSNCAGTWNWRGGTGVFFNNGACGGPVLQYYRAQGLATPSLPTAGLDGYPFGGTNYDGFGFPGRDQPGRGAYNTASPIYAWGNTGSFSISRDDGHLGLQSVVEEGRDYYTNTQRPGYVPYPYPHPLQTSTPPPINLFPTAPNDVLVK